MTTWADQNNATEERPRHVVYWLEDSQVWECPRCDWTETEDPKALWHYKYAHLKEQS